MRTYLNLIFNLKFILLQKSIKERHRKMKQSCQFTLLLLSLLSICITITSAVPKPDENRVMDHDFNQHIGSEHSKQYDHEAFLGEDQAKTFDQLEPEESRRRLG